MDRSGDLPAGDRTSWAVGLPALAWRAPQMAAMVRRHIPLPFRPGCVVRFDRTSMPSSGNRSVARNECDRGRRERTGSSVIRLGSELCRGRLAVAKSGRAARPSALLGLCAGVGAWPSPRAAEPLGQAPTSQSWSVSRMRRLPRVQEEVAQRNAVADRHDLVEVLFRQ